MMPTLFISHGAPNLELTDTPAARFLKDFATLIPAPEAILCASAHWETRRPALTTTREPETIHDFFGFPRELYALEYGAPGSPDLARNVVRLLDSQDMAADVDPERGLDHGAWAPLRLMYPAADIPVVQLSLQTNADPAHHLKVGRALYPLREQGVLIMGSGGATHNLREFHKHPLDAPAVEQAVEFDHWLHECITAGDAAALIDYLQRGPHARWNHPTADHFLPLFVALGAAGDDGAQKLHGSFTYGVLSMAAYGWGL